MNNDLDWHHQSVRGKPSLNLSTMVSMESYDQLSLYNPSTMGPGVQLQSLAEVTRVSQRLPKVTRVCQGSPKESRVSWVFVPQLFNMIRRIKRKIS